MIKFIDRMITKILIDREYKKVQKRIKKSLKNTWQKFRSVL
jgi:hypothetical protein